VEIDSNDIDFFIRAQDAENTIKANIYAINTLDDYFQKIGEDCEINMIEHVQICCPMHKPSNS
jgi:hypothetical protein